MLSIQIYGYSWIIYKHFMCETQVRTIIRFICYYGLHSAESGRVTIWRLVHPRQLISSFNNFFSKQNWTNLFFIFIKNVVLNLYLGVCKWYIMSFKFLFVTKTGIWLKKNLAHIEFMEKIQDLQKVSG